MLEPDGMAQRNQADSYARTRKRRKIAGYRQREIDSGVLLIGEWPSATPRTSDRPCSDPHLPAVDAPMVTDVIPSGLALRTNRAGFVKTGSLGREGSAGAL